jgi:hypothetical protein
MKKWLKPLIGLTLSLAIVGAVTAFVLTGDAPDGEGNPTIEDPPLPKYEDWVSDHTIDGEGNPTIEDPPLPKEDASPVVTGGGAPRASLTYEGLAYYQDPLRTDEAAGINKDDLELVGATTESNILAPGGGESLNIYKLKDGEEGYLYTLEPGRSFENEDGTTITIEAEWIRWTSVLDPSDCLLDTEMSLRMTVLTHCRQNDNSG